MQVVESISDVRLVRCGLPGSWGLVPTMGFLHAGHLALVERARAENDSESLHGETSFVTSLFGPDSRASPSAYKGGESGRLGRARHLILLEWVSGISVRSCESSSSAALFVA